ncbi:uncharacterized protein LOC143146149 [Ptiloglossa arizonensis]|uniref:uncharacterized protein LOC143146149 n=1 Tax=Ptiloglossa arizonensis TaxID=3350558 RepID=UPI003F9F39ED
MEGRYAAMERELTRTKMLVPMMARNAIPVHRMSQTDVNWKECTLAKRWGHSYGILAGNQGKNINGRDARNQERINVSSRRKHQSARKGRESSNRITDDTDWTKRRNSGQYFQEDIYPIKDSNNHTCRPRTLNNNSTAICSTHNVAVILPQDSSHSTVEDSRYERNIFKYSSLVELNNSTVQFQVLSNNLLSQTTLLFKVVLLNRFYLTTKLLEQPIVLLQTNNNVPKEEKCDAIKIFGNPKKSVTPFKTRPLAPTDNKNDIALFLNRSRTITAIHDEKTLMEACQRFDKKHEPETSYFIDFDVKHEDHTQASSTVNTPNFRPIMGPEFSNDISKRKPEVERQGRPNNTDERSRRTKFFENADTRRRDHLQVNQTFQGGRAHWNTHPKKSPYERTKPTSDQRNFTRHFRTQKRIPTPRSNVHTASTSIMQPSTTNPMLDPNGLTIQLLRLAVLLYAPILMPALNLLIARQCGQTTVPIPCFEGSNDLLTQVFLVLSNQQRVPNLLYPTTNRFNENSQFPAESNSPDSSSSKLEPRYQNNSKQFRGVSTAESSSNRHERSSIAVNTSPEMSTCNDAKLSSTRCSESSLCEQVDEDRDERFARSDGKEENVYERNAFTLYENSCVLSLSGRVAIEHSSIPEILRIDDPTSVDELMGSAKSTKEVLRVRGTDILLSHL